MSIQGFHHITVQELDTYLFSAYSKWMGRCHVCLSIVASFKGGMNGVFKRLICPPLALLSAVSSNSNQALVGNDPVIVGSSLNTAAYREESLLVFSVR